MIVIFLGQVSFCYSQNVITYAGNGIFAYTGDGVQATTTSLAAPYGIAVDAAGNLYIADFDNNRIRKVNTSGVITTIAGTGVYGFSGDGGPATLAQIREPYAVAVDNSGNVYFTDNNRIRKINTSGIISTIAGNGNIGFSGDGGLATAATFDYPIGLAVDASGNVYVADWANNRIRKINSSGIISTFAGNGSPNFSGDGGLASSASLHYPLGVCTDFSGNVYIADSENDRIRKVNSSGIITTVVGSGTILTNGASATSVGIDYPVAVTADAIGNIYLIVENFDRICKVNTSGIINIIANKWPNGYSGDGGPAINAVFNYPKGLAIDATGSLFVCDQDNHRVRVICALPSLPGPINGNSTICPGSSVYIYSVTPTNGASTYSWSLPGGWNGTSTTNSISVNTNGTAGTITLTAINACGSSSGQTTLAVTVGTLPSVSISPSNTVSCSGDVLNLTANGANTYSWSTGSIGNNISVTPVTSTTYTVIGTDVNGCTNTAIQSISVNPLPVLNISASSNSLCSGQADTLISSGAITYTWLPSGSNTSSIIVSPNSNQTYTVFGTDALGCSNFSQAIISVSPTPTLIVTPFFYLCSGSATLNANGASSYTWMPGSLTGNIISPSPTITTNYTVVGAIGVCTNSAISTVSIGIAPPLFLSSNVQSGCKGTCVTFSNSSNYFNPFTYLWGDSSTATPMVSSHCYSVSGNYSVVALATYSSGCSVMSSGVSTITIFPSPVPGIGIVGGNTQILNYQILFNNTSMGAESFVWNFADGSSNFNTLSLNGVSHTYTVLGNYCIKLIATDTVHGCRDSTNQCLDIICISELNTPNVFTPNGDGINDVFKFKTNCVSSLNCTIYNKWGLEIYQWTGINGGWDGRTTSGQAVDSGVYFYVLEYINESGNLVKNKGFVSLFN